MIRIRPVNDSGPMPPNTAACDVPLLASVERVIDELPLPHADHFEFQATPSPKIVDGEFARRKIKMTVKGRRGPIRKAAPERTVDSRDPR